MNKEKRKKLKITKNWTGFFLTLFDFLNHLKVGVQSTIQFMGK
jgi:hypothetical protein